MILMLRNVDGSIFLRPATTAPRIFVIEDEVDQPMAPRPEGAPESPFWGINRGVRFTRHYRRVRGLYPNTLRLRTDEPEPAGFEYEEVENTGQLSAGQRIARIEDAESEMLRLAARIGELSAIDAAKVGS